MVESSKKVTVLRNEMTELLEDSEIINQVIVPEWIYFPDFRDEMIDSRVESNNS
jgi:hypothetical protein